MINLTIEEFGEVLKGFVAQEVAEPLKLIEELQDRVGMLEMRLAELEAQQ